MRERQVSEVLEPFDALKTCELIVRQEKFLDLGPLLADLIQCMDLLKVERDLLLADEGLLLGCSLPLDLAHGL